MLFWLIEVGGLSLTFEYLDHVLMFTKGLPESEGIPSYENDLPPLEQSDASPVEFHHQPIYGQPPSFLLEQSVDNLSDFSHQVIWILF